MNTALECMPCFMKMALREARLACPSDESIHRAVVMEWGRMLSELDLTQPPPAIARHLAELVRKMTGCGDLYVEDKKEANACMQAVLPQLEERIEAERRNGGDPLALALELAVIGNYMDRGVELEVDIERELDTVSKSLNADILSELKSRIENGCRVLLLGDNTGEIVLDKLLVRELKTLGCDVTYAVRSHPVINDATIADAQHVGMTDLCEVIESGVDTPGTVLDRCSEAFLERMQASDCILSKGQGNFEALEGRRGGVFCAFKVKCKRVAQDTGLPFGSSALWKTTSSQRHPRKDD